ncbi:MAG: metal-dependent hydrolase [Candidatus Hodarchaeota archaeon]
MDPIAHLEWTIGIGLICLAFWNMSVDMFGFLLLGIGSEFPDLFDWALFRGKEFFSGHREFSHTIFFIIILIILAQFIPILGFLAFGSILHIIEDIIAGRDPVYLFSPLSHRGGIMLIDKDQSIQIGAKVRNLIKGSYKGSENIGDELSWFWFLTILGSWILIIGIFVYFS